MITLVQGKPGLGMSYQAIAPSLFDDSCPTIQCGQLTSNHNEFIVHKKSPDSSIDYLSFYCGEYDEEYDFPEDTQSCHICGSEIDEI